MRALFVVRAFAVVVALGALPMHLACQVIGGIEAASDLAADAATFDGSDALSDASAPVPIRCSAPAECASLLDSPCQHATCIDGRCGAAAEPDGPLAVQVAGDCKRVECASGARVEVAAPDDPPAPDGRACVEAVCVGLSAEQRPKSATVPCGDAGFCNGSGDCGPCKSGNLACFAGGVPAVCTQSGVWNLGVACGSGKVCAAGLCVDQPSCASLALCQGGTRTCCDAPSPRGGSFAMGRGTTPTATDLDSAGFADEVPEHQATLTPSSLEVFPVTVGRFRKFVNQYGGGPPPSGAGAHPSIAGSGWQAAFNVSLAADQAGLRQLLACPLATWTDTQGTVDAEQRPINCVNWFEAFAFCIWDGGRLPTEAEWEYAAAGAALNYKYPWGQVPPGPTHLVGNCLYDGTAGCAVSDIARVGLFEAGKGQFGHYDLAGSVRAWTLDWYLGSFYASVTSGCTDCANLTPAIKRATRGGGSFAQADALTRSATRASSSPNLRDGQTGIRCAR